VLLPPGTSLETSNAIAGMVDERIKSVKGVLNFSRRTGRAELDEHAEGVNASEIIISFDPHSGRGREEVLEELREELTQVPGVVVSVEQPLAHLISHMLSGVKAQVGIKLYGDDLEVLRRTAEQMKAAITGVPGVKDLMVEQQTEIPQLQIKLKRDKLMQYGLTADEINEFVETAMNGKTVSEIVQGERKFDLVVRLDDKHKTCNILRCDSFDCHLGGAFAHLFLLLYFSHLSSVLALSFSWPAVTESFERSFTSKFV
jgi:HME family heavy-metal exporter